MIIPIRTDIASQTGQSNLDLREGRKYISVILWHYFSRKHYDIWAYFCEIGYIKLWKIIIIAKNWQNLNIFFEVFHNFPFLFYNSKLRYQNGRKFSWKKLPQNIRLEISCLPSCKAKLLYPVWVGIPCSIFQLKIVKMLQFL